MDLNTYVSANEILSEVLVTCGDTELSNGVTKNWYFARMRDALKNLGYDTYFSTITKDIYNWIDDHEPKGKHQIWLPEGCFSLKEIYLFSGECCELNSSVKVHWKRQYNNIRTASGKYTAGRNEQNKDEFYRKDSLSHTSPSATGGMASHLIFANVQNGLLMINSQHYDTSYENLRLIYSGVHIGDIKDSNIIPDFFKTAIHDYVAEKFFRSKLVSDARKYRLPYEEIKGSLYGDRQRDGSWVIAARRVKKMSKWEKESLNQYLSRANE